MRSTSEWPSYNGGYDATRYSSLSQINTTNVSSLAEVARFKLPETTSFQSGPVLVDGTMYVTTANNTYAFDPRTGEQRWIQKFEPKSAGIGTPVRGVGYADGRLFRGTPDGHLLALDAKTGAVIWDVVGADATIGEYYTAAPIVWEGRVYMANSGSDVGAIGHIRAFDTQTGKQIWNFDIVPSTGPGSETWPKDTPRVGGGVYSSFALDTDTGMLYSPTGNPGPDFVASHRPGDNLYTSSVVMLDARTGALRGYHQLVKNDFHDWDLAASPILFTSQAGRKMVAAAGKNGYLYGLDRDLKTVHFSVPVTRIENVDAPLTKEGTRFLPGAQGGTNWYGPTYSPQANAIYVPTIDWATTIKLGGPETLTLKPGTPFLGSSNAFGDQDPISQRLGHVTAVDADSGKVVWKYDADTSMVASVTPTAGGLVLTGDTKGNLLAFDARTGQVLLKKNLGDPIGGGVDVRDRRSAVRRRRGRHEEHGHAADGQRSRMGGDSRSVEVVVMPPPEFRIFAGVNGSAHSRAALGVLLRGPWPDDARVRVVAARRIRGPHQRSILLSALDRRADDAAGRARRTLAARWPDVEAIVVDKCATQFSPKPESFVRT